MKNLVKQPGDDIQLTAPTGGWTAGQLVIVLAGVTGICGVVVADAAAGTLATVKIKNCIVEVPAETGAGTDAPVGTVMYRKASDGKLGEASTNNTRAGRLAKAKGTSDATAWLVLNMP